MPLIQIKDISVSFNTGTANEVRALQNISLAVPLQSFVVLLGANGSGKSTLFNALAGSVAVDAGTIIIDNENITNVIAHKRGRWFARVFQNPLQGTVGGLSVVENFRIAALRTASYKNIIKGIDSDFRQKVHQCIEQSGLPLTHKLDSLMGSLSGGQRQALTLLMATMAHSRVLLMDEPTAALDPRSADMVIQTTQKIYDQSGVTIFFVTHNMKEAVNLGNRLIIFKQGKINVDTSGAEKKEWDLKRLHDWFDAEE